MEGIHAKDDAVPGLAENILGLTRLRKQRETAFANMAQPLRLKLVAPLGRNPGELRMLEYVPPGLPAGAPLVVVLHGCTQNAAAYDNGSGWSTLAERHGFAVLYPEQQRGNNPNLCFNWFSPEDVSAGSGEVQSIREMVEQSVRTHGLDPRRVFLTGLSAGGAMSAACLATAPELFAGVGIIAGLPYKAATTMHEAFGAMGGPPARSAREWGNLVRKAGATPMRWPAVQIWHGTEDHTVGPRNGEALLAQWRDVLGLPETPTLVRAREDGAHHSVWENGSALPPLEYWSVPGLGHGTPITPDDADADRSVGTEGPHMLASTVSSTFHLARRWGLLTQLAAARPDRPARAAENVTENAPGPEYLLGKYNPAAIVEKALRTAGLLR